MPAAVPTAAAVWCSISRMSNGSDSLGEHAEASRRLLDQPARLSLDSGQSQLVSWLANSPVSDPLIAQQGAVLLLASLNHAQPAELAARRLPYAALDAHIEQNAAYPLQVADLARVAGLSSARLHARFMAECGRRQWITSAVDACISRCNCCATQVCRSVKWPVGSATARRVPSRPPSCVSSVRHPASFGAIPATKDDSLPTDFWPSPSQYEGAAAGCDLLILSF
jgi:hypothetical protein